jgi:hypothetical protein
MTLERAIELYNDCEDFAKNKRPALESQLAQEASDRFPLLPLTAGVRAISTEVWRTIAVHAMGERK